MKKIIFTFVVTAFALSATGASAAVDMFIKIDDIKGESVDSTDTTEVDTRLTADQAETADEADTRITDDQPETTSADMFMKIDDIKGESVDSTDGADATVTTDTASSGKVEATRKIEEGQQAPGIEPDEIDASMRQHTNFGLLLRGGRDDDSDDDGVDEKMVDNDSDGSPDLDGTEPAIMEERKRAYEDGILQAVQKNTDVPIEIVQLNHEEEQMEVEVRHTVRLFGLIPIETRAEITIDVDENIEVKLPWWTFFATGKDKVGLGTRVLNAILGVL